jgi:hypothetical protein
LRRTCTSPAMENDPSQMRCCGPPRCASGGQSMSTMPSAISNRLRDAGTAIDSAGPTRGAVPDPAGAGARHELGVHRRFQNASNGARRDGIAAQQPARIRIASILSSNARFFS